MSMGRKSNRMRVLPYQLSLDNANHSLGNNPMKWRSTGRGSDQRSERHPTLSRLDAPRRLDTVDVEAAGAGGAGRDHGVTEH